MRIRHAAVAGGQYFRARDPQPLANIYSIIDELEPVEQEAETYRPIRALYYWPLSAALLIFTLLLILDTRRRYA